MGPSITRGVVTVTLVPLLMAEFPSLLRLVFAELRAVAVHHELVLMMVTHAIPFGALMLPLGISTPISGTAPTGSVAIGSIGLSGRVGHGRRCIIARAIAAANPDGRASLRNAEPPARSRK